MTPSGAAADPALGRQLIDWAGAHMPVLQGIAREWLPKQPFQGIRLGLCLHLEAKTARLIEVLAALGAEVAVAGSNPLSTNDHVASALQQNGVKVFARRGQSLDEYAANLQRVLDTRPHYLIDDGADLVATYVAGGGTGVKAAAEETTTGVLRLKALEREGRLPFPVVAVNDTPMKRLFDNRFGTGQSVWDAILRATNRTLAGRTVVVVGFGPCGQGVAERARGLGARVGIVEADPIRANEAWFHGYAVWDMQQAARVGEFFVTVTGNVAVIRGEHMLAMPDGAVLANAGHFDVEIAKDDLERLGGPAKTVRPGVEAYRIGDKTLYLLAEGRLVNLALGDGHPVEIMDLSFSLQLLTLLYLQSQPDVPRAVLPVPASVDREVALRHLAAHGLGLETLTARQAAYLASWREGTRA